MKLEDTYKASVILLRDHPEWRNILIAAVEEARTVPTSSFAGAWVLARAKKSGVDWMPNLRKLVAYGILKKDGKSTRGGRRAYYAMPDVANVERALKDTVSTASNASPYASPKNRVNIKTERPMVKVPFFADLASCGGPSLSDAHIERYVDVDTRLAKPGYRYYLVRTTGNSMDQAGITSGDTVLVRIQSYADIGQKVVACLTDGVTIKELQHKGDLTVLVPRSSNPKHKPIILSGDAQIQGVVVAVIPNFLQ